MLVAVVGRGKYEGWATGWKNFSALPNARVNVKMTTRAPVKAKYHYLC